MPETKYTLETLLRGLNILSLYTRETPALTLTEITKATNLIQEGKGYQTIFKIQRLVFKEASKT